MAAIMALDATIASEREEVSRLQVSTNDATADVVAAFDALRSTRAYLNGLIARRDRQFAALGVAESASLIRLKQSKFLQQRMNALALKHRMRDKLRQRKFENERLERAYRRTVNGMVATLLCAFMTFSELNIQSLSTRSTLLDPCNVASPQYRNYPRNTMNSAVVWLTSLPQGKHHKGQWFLRSFLLVVCGSWMWMTLSGKTLAWMKMTIMVSLHSGFVMTKYVLAFGVCWTLTGALRRRNPCTESVWDYKIGWLKNGL